MAMLHKRGSEGVRRGKSVRVYHYGKTTVLPCYFENAKFRNLKGKFSKTRNSDSDVCNCIRRGIVFVIVVWLV